MASKFKIETREEKIDRMMADNPGRPIELCSAVVDSIWDKKREAVLGLIPERFKDATVSDLGYLADDVTDAVDALFSSPKNNDIAGIIFAGAAGSGKTYAAYAVLKMLADRNPEILSVITSYPKMMQELRQEFASGTYDDLGSTWDRLNNNSGMYDGLLFIDDMSSTKPTDFELDKLMIFIDQRVNEYMPFLLTTNLEPEDFMSAFGPRLASRLLGYTRVVLFEPLDRRIEKTI